MVKAMIIRWFGEQGQVGRAGVGLRRVSSYSSIWWWFCAVDGVARGCKWLFLPFWVMRKRGKGYCKAKAWVVFWRGVVVEIGIQ